MVFKMRSLFLLLAISPTIKSTYEPWFDGRLFSLVNASSPVTLVQAETVCASNGGRVAVFTDQDKELEIVKQFRLQSNVTVWTGSRTDNDTQTLTSVLCEKPRSNEFDWDELIYNDQSIFFSRAMDATDHDSAVRHCKELDATLVIADQKIRSYMLDKAVHMDTSGLLLDNRCLPVYDCPFVKGFPITDFGNCVAMATRGQATGMYMTIPCQGTALPYFCTKPALRERSTCKEAIHLIPYQSQDLHIFSPGFPGRPLEAKCSFIVTVPKGNIIELEIELFYLDQRFDGISIYDGLFQQLPFVKLSGKVEKGKKIRSTGSAIIIEFGSRGDSSSVGFDIIARLIHQDESH